MSANTTVTFSTSGSTDSLTIELDAERNSDKTSFSYGQKCYFRIYGASLDSLIVSATAGTIKSEGMYTSDRDSENIQFIDDHEYEFSYPINGVTSFEWFGQNLGAVTKTSSTAIQCEIAPDPTLKKIGLAAVVVSAQYALYSITLPTQTKSEFPVLIDVRTAS